MAKRAFDLLVSAAGLAALAPAFLLISLAVLLDSGFPVFFRQKRVGRHGRAFDILKFRSMRAGAPGAAITAGNDRRITRIGRLLRRYKLDELPQLWNVFRGDMSLVGPRPEVPRYVDLRDPAWHGVLQAAPGITDVASLVYRHEEELLARAADVDDYYRRTILPAKLALNLAYLTRRSLWRDLEIILVTVRYSLAPASFDAARLEKLLH
jgi:lipopolysaccharide/colanic/teichoic acid biosynthesis glycosyltransferase